MASLVTTTVTGTLTTSDLITVTQAADNNGIRFKGYDDVNSYYGKIGLNDVGYLQVFAEGNRSIDLKSGRQIRFYTSTDNSTYNNSVNFNSDGSSTFSGAVKIQSTAPTIKLYDTNSDTDSVQVELNGGNFRLYKYTGSTDASHAEIFKLTTAGVVTLAGALTGTSGTFSAGLIATTISGTSGTFSSTVTSVDGLLSNYHQVYATGTTGFLIATNIVATTYGFIFGEIRLEQFNVSSYQTINFSCTVLPAGTVYSKEATADIAVTIKLFNYDGKWYIWVPSPSTFTTISAFVNLGAGYQGSTRGSNAITSVTAAAVPASGVTNSTDLVARQRIIANTSGQVFIGSATTTGGKLMVSSSDNTVYDASQASHQRDEGSTLMINNESTTAGSFSQLLLRNRSSNVGGCRIVSIDSGADDSELAIVTGDTNESMRILGDGNVGIGTDAPGSKLDVIGTTTVRYAAGNFSTKRLDIQAANTSNLIQSVTNPLHIYDNSAIRICMLQGGSVGIGTDNPGSKLHIKDATNPPEIRFENVDGGTQTAKIVYNQSGENKLVLSTQYQSSTDLNLIQFAPADNVAMTIRGGTGSSDGFVGIGTNAPATKLHVDGDSGITLEEGGSTTRKLIITPPLAGTSGIIQTNGTSNGLLIKSSSGGNQLFLKDDGRVGIGTAAPDQIFQVRVAANKNLRVRADSTAVQINARNDANAADVPFYLRGSLFNFQVGSVGIGTTTPYRNAHIYQAPDVNNLEGALQVGGTTAVLGGYFGYNSTGSGRLSIISLNNSGGSNASIYLGFGLATNGSPTTKVLTLDQNKLVTFGGGMLIPNGSAIVSKNTSGTDVLLLVINSSNELMFGSAAVGNAGHPIRFLSKYITFEPANGLGACTETMRVLNGTFAGAVGSVGIGTTTPQYLLEVYGDATLNSSGSTTDVTLRLEAAGATKWRIKNDTAVAGGTADTLTFTSAGTANVSINQAGNVGIGTNNAATLLDVTGGAGAYGLRLGPQSDSGTFSGRLFFAGSSGTNAILRYGSYLAFTTGATAPGASGTVRMVVLDDGNVGIGATAPSTKLHVEGQGTFANNGANIILKNTWASGNQDILFGGGSVSTGAASNTAARIRSLATAPGGAATGDLLFTVNSGDTFVDALYVQEDGNVGIGTTNPGGRLETYVTAGGQFGLRLNSNFAGGNAVDFKPYISSVSNAGFSIDLATSTKFVINSDGNVGIGTVSPAAHLHLYKASGTTTVLTEVNSNSTLGYEIKKTGTTTQHWKIVDGQTVNGVLEFYDATDSLTRMAIDGNGNVGINDSSPTYKLDVNGTGRFTGALTASTVTASDGGGFTGSGASLTGLNATQLTSGTVNVNRLGSSGTRNNTTFLRGDNTWQTVSSGGVSGSGTDHYIPRWNGTAALQNSDIIALDSGCVGIGTNNPGGRLAIRTTANEKSLWMAPSAATTASVLHMECDSLTTGSGIYVHSNTNDTGTRKLVYINNDHTSATGATCLYINQDSTGAAISTNDANLYGIIGRAKFGYVGHGDYAAFAHRDVGTTTSYALLQDSVGSTFLNAANGKIISFRINNANVIAMDSTSLYSVTNNAEALGKTGNRWSNVYSVLGNFSGDITVGGNWNGLDWEDLPNISTLGALPA